LDLLAARQALREMADYLGLPIETVRDEVLANAAQAARIAASFGAVEAGQIIATSGGSNAGVPEFEPEPAGPPSRRTPRCNCASCKTWRRSPSPVRRWRTSFRWWPRASSVVSAASAFWWPC
jgi:hypothetical protein